MRTSIIGYLRRLQNSWDLYTRNFNKFRQKNDGVKQKRIKKGIGYVYLYIIYILYIYYI